LSVRLSFTPPSPSLYLSSAEGANSHLPLGTKERPRNTMVEVERRRFESANSAFENFDADSVAFARLATKMLKQLGRALSTLRGDAPPGGYFVSRYGNQTRMLMFELLQNGDAAKISAKTWKCVKVRGFKRVCFYSDSYHLDLQNAARLATACRNVNIQLRIFEWDYPRLAFANGYIPDTGAKVIGDGYDRLYRGKLVGFMLRDERPAQLWRRLRDAVRVRPYILFWLQFVQEKLYRPGGVGFQEELACWESIN